MYEHLGHVRGRMHGVMRWCMHDGFIMLYTKVIRGFGLFVEPVPIVILIF